MDYKDIIVEGSQWMDATQDRSSWHFSGEASGGRLQPDDDHDD